MSYGRILILYVTKIHLFVGVDTRTLHHKYVFFMKYGNQAKTIAIPKFVSRK